MGHFFWVTLYLKQLNVCLSLRLTLDQLILEPIFEELYLFISICRMVFARLSNNEYIPECSASIQTNSAESDPQWHHRRSHRHQHLALIHINIFLV